MNGLQGFFMEGGFGMWPTLLFGTLALALALRYAVKPKAELFPLVTGLGAAALLAGCLGMVMGLKATASAVAGHPELEAPGRLALAGFSESANNLVLALVLCTLVVLTLGVGAYRSRLVRAA